MSYVSDELGMTIMEVGDPADLTTISDALERIDAYAAAIDEERANIKALLGNVGKDSGGSMLIDGQTARVNLGTPDSASIASVESSSTASASHAKDSHFMLGDTLRKATSAIAAGESITNSNSTTDTLQGQIDTLRDSVSLRVLTTAAASAEIHQSNSTGQLFCVYATAKDNHRYGLLVETTKLTCYDFTDKSVV